MTIVTILYYALVTLVSVVLVYNFVKATRWEKEALYILVLLPFLLRVLGLK